MRLQISAGVVCFNGETQGGYGMCVTTEVLQSHEKQFMSSGG